MHRLWYLFGAFLAVTGLGFALLSGIDRIIGG
jgi:hypothetical protein